MQIYSNLLIFSVQTHSANKMSQNATKKPTENIGYILTEFEEKKYNWSNAVNATNVALL